MKTLNIGVKIGLQTTKFYPKATEATDSQAIEAKALKWLSRIW